MVRAQPAACGTRTLYSTLGCPSALQTSTAVDVQAAAPLIATSGTTMIPTRYIEIDAIRKEGLMY